MIYTDENQMPEIRPQASIRLLRQEDSLEEETLSVKLGVIRKHSANFAARPAKTAIHRMVSSACDALNLVQLPSL